jgi:hypothetical protein
MSGAQAPGLGVTMNGEPVPFTGIGPQQIGGRVLVPVRGVLEKIGANVSWLPESRTVIAGNGQVDIRLKLGDRQAVVNGNPVTLDVPAQEIAGSTMVPLRFLGEALGAHIRWDAATSTVQITMNDHIGGATPNPPSDAQPTIASFEHNAKGWLQAGQTLRVVMSGTPGGQAAFRIPGVVEEVAMEERAPGRYVGTWQVPQKRSLQLTDAAVIGSLQIGDRSAPMIQAGQLISVDAVPPRIRDHAPEADTRVSTPRPNIYAVFEDQGSGVDRDSIRLVVNGRDVTANANVTRDFISYTPDAALPAGQNTVQLTVADKAGNVTQSAWSFTRGGRGNSGINSVFLDADHPLEPGDTFAIKAVGTPGSKVTYSVGRFKDLPMDEVSPGNFAATHTIRRGEDLRNAPVTVNLVTPDGDRYTQNATRSLTVSTGKPTAPVITFPGPNDRPASPLVIRGSATPNTQVRVKVNYKNSILGVFALQGTAADTVVDVDRNGNWRTDPISLQSLGGSGGVQYTITATSFNDANQTSDPTSFSFRVR